MKRRSFVKNSSLTTIAIGLVPGISLAQDPMFSITELMGKEDIPLFGDKGSQLREEPYEAFTQMKKAAYSDGIDLKIVSGYRDFYRQRTIWEGKFARYTEDNEMKPLDAIDKIIEYSTIPGTSRHHWGTDMDIYDGYRKTNGGDILVPGNYEGDGPFADLKRWMDEHASKYDFYLVYTNEPKRRGFKYEPWHYSYAPLSVPMLTEFRKKNIMALLGKEDIDGFSYFTTGFVRSYIQDNLLDINPVLL